MSAPSVSPPSAPADRPELARLAELVHRSVADHPEARLVSVSFEQSGSFELAFWDIPPLLSHPVDPLVGFSAPASWDAVGLVSSGRLRRLDDRHAAPEPVVSVVLIERSGRAASVLGDGTGPLQVLHEPPGGWVADVLCRILGLATPPPEHSVAALIDLTWLDRLAAGLLHRPARGRSWAWLADRHPLRGGGATPSPEELSSRTAREAERHPWSALRARAGAEPLPASWAGPPQGDVLDARSWFDDGSISRWALRHLPPAEALVPDLLAVLPPEVGRSLLLALVDADQPGT